MTREERQSLLDAAENQVRMRNFDEAEKLATEVLVSTDPLNILEREQHIVALLRLADVADKRSDYVLALERYSAALALYESAGEDTRPSTLLRAIGVEYFNLSDLRKAQEYYNRALKLDEAREDKAGISASLCNLGNVYSALAQPTQALECFTKALAIDEERGDKASIASVLGNIGIVYSNISDFAHALEYYRRSLELNEELGRTANVAGNLHNIGSVYRDLSDFAMAVEYYNRALDLNRNVGNKNWIARNLGGIGTVHARLMDFAKALEYYREALEISTELGDRMSVAVNLTNIGVVHADLLDYSKALDYYMKALAINEELGLNASMAADLNNIGDVHEKQHDYDSAIEFYRRSLKLFEGGEYKSQVANVHSSMGILYAIEEWSGFDAGKAESYLLKSIAVSNDLGKKEYREHKYLSELYERQGRWKESQLHIKRYCELKDAVLNEEARNSIMLVDQKRMMMEREKELVAERADAAATTKVLRKMLPSSIADRLIAGEQNISDYLPNVSILFADIVGFTPISSYMPAHVVVRFLNFVFARFDHIMKEYGCEKIKTMGDGYMAVAGAPLQCDDHAERIAHAALAMQEDIQLPDDIRRYIDAETVFNIRIGIHTGAAVGGIIGDERFVYDVYSDAVNLAARMESSGEPGTIHVSSEFALHLENRMNMMADSPTFRLVRRGQLDIKGKGMMRTYFLEKA